MPSARSKDQVFIGGWFHEDFVAAIDKARGAVSRSEFQRVALREKLERMGIKVKDEATIAPARTGKGGPRRRLSASSAERGGRGPKAGGVSSRTDAVAAKALGKGVAAVIRPAK